MSSPLSSLYCKTPVSASESPGYFRQLISIKDLKNKKLKQLYEQELNEKNDVLEELGQVKQEIVTLKRESKDKATLVRQLNETISLLEAQLEDENEDEKTKIRNSLERKFKSEIQILEQRFDHCLKEKNELECWKEKAEAKIRTLARDIKIRNVELTELEGIKHALTSTVQEQNYEISALKTSYNELRDMLTELNPQKNISIDDSFHGHLPEATESLAVVVELQLQEKVEENERLQTQVERLQTGLREKDFELKNLSTTFSQLQESKNIVERQLTEEITNLDSSISKLRAENSEINCKIAENLKELSTMTSKYNDEYSRNQHLKGKLSQLQVSFDEKLKVISENEEAHFKLLEEFKNLKSAFSVLEENKRDSENKLNQEILNLQSLFNNVTDQNALLQQEIDAKNSALLTISSRYEHEVDQNQELSKKLIELESSFAETFKELTCSKEISQKLGEEINHLNTVLAELEQSKNQQMQLLNEEISQLKNDLSDLAQQNNDLKCDVEEKHAELSTMSAKQEIERKENQRLQQELDAKCSELLTMSLNYQNEHDQNQELNKKLIESKSSYDEIYEELTSSKETSEMLKKKIGHLNVVLSELEESKNQQVEQLNEEISRLRQDLTDLVEQNSALKRDIEEKKAELQTMSVNQEIEQNKNQRLQQELDAKCSELLTMSLNCQNEHDQNQELNKKLIESESYYDEIYKELTSSKETSEMLKEKIGHLNVVLSELEESKTQQVEQLNEEISRLRQDLTDSVEQNSVLKRDIEVKIAELQTMSVNQEIEQNKNQRLQQELDAKCSELLTMSLNCQNEHDQNQELSKKLIESESAYDEIYKALTSSKETSEMLEEKIGHLNGLLSELEESKNQQAEQLNEEISRLRHDLTDSVDQSSALKREIEEKRAELLTMSLNHESERDKNQRLSEKLSELESSLDEKVKELFSSKEAVQKLEGELKQMQTCVQNLTKENDNLKAEIDVKSDELQNLIKNNEVMAAENAKSLDEIKTLTAKNVELTKENVELTDAYNKLQDDFERQRIEMTETNELLSRQVEEYRESSQKFKLEVQRQMQQMTDNYEDRLVEIEQKDDELNDLRSALSQLQESKNEVERQLTEEITNLQSTINKVTIENSDINCKIEENLKELSTMTSHYNDECSRNQHLSEELSQLQASFDEKLKVIAENEDAHSKLLEEFKNLKSVHSALEESKIEAENQLKQEISGLQSLLNNLTDKNALLQEEIDAKNSELLTASSRYENEHDLNQDLNKKVVELEFSLGETFKELTSSKETSGMLEEKIGHLNGALAELEGNKNRQIEQLNEEISQLRHDLTDSVEQNSGLKRDIEEKRAELLTMSLNQESERDKNQRLNEKLSKLESSLDEKVKELLTSKEAASKLEDELKDMKSKFMEFAENNNQVVTNMKGEFLQMETYVKELTKQNNDLKAEIDLKSAELQNLSRNQEGEAAENAKTLDEIKGLLEKNIELKDENSELKEAYNKLLDDFERHRTEMTEMNEVLSKQVEEYRDASEKYESKWKERMKQVKEDYEGQLTKIKQYMTKHYHDKMEKQEKETDEKLKMYKEKIAKDQDCIKDLSSQIWNLSEKYLQAQQEVKNLTSNNRRATISRLDLAKSPDGQLLRSMSVDHLRGGWEKEREKLIVKNDNNDFVDEVTYTRRRKLVPSGIGKKLSLQSGKVFPSEEDEDGEMFDAACLADLKEGRVRLSPDRDMRRQSSRLSILQARNSLCPPHLKSSYPAETQFLHPAQIKEDDIKVFTAQKLGLGDIASETGSIVSNSDRKKKDAGQTLYKKPGPPTPSKHGGRLSHGGGPLPKSPLENKENISTRVKHPSTPSKIMDFFRNKMRREERPQPIAFSISPGVNPTTNKTRRSGFFTKKSERV